MRPARLLYLSSSATDVMPTLADSNTSVVTFSWTSPNFAAVDSSTEKYVVELDSSGHNFMKPLQYTVTGSRSFSLSGSQLNNALVAWGFNFNTAYTVDVRVVASHSNNNEQSFSNVVSVKMTPYTVPFALQASTAGPLNITIQNKNDDIAMFNWQSPSFTNATYTYAIQYDTAGASFANAKTIVDSLADSSFSIKAIDLNNYAMTAGIPAGKQGVLDFRIVATINGKQQAYSNTKTITVTPNVLLAVLYVPGDYQGWSPSTAPVIASTDAISYDGYVNLTNTNGFKFTSEPDWDHTNYGDAGAGKLSTSGGNITVPSAGYYRVQANLSTLTWSATLTQWGIVGAATPKGWDASTPLSFDAATNTWVIQSVALKADAYKFRANDGWDINLGGDPAKLTYGGGNITVTEAGNYKVVLNLSNPAAYTCTLTKL